MSSIDLTNLHECQGNGTDENGNKVDPITLEPLYTDVNNVIKIGKYCFNADSYKEYFKIFSWDNYSVNLDEDPLEVWLGEIERNPDIPFRSGFGPVFTREQLIDLYNRFSTYEQTYGEGLRKKNKRKHNRRKTHRRNISKNKKMKNKKTKGRKNKKHLTKKHK